MSPRDVARRLAEAALEAADVGWADAEKAAAALEPLVRDALVEAVRAERQEVAELAAARLREVGEVVRSVIDDHRCDKEDEGLGMSDWDYDRIFAADLRLEQDVEGRRYLPWVLG